MSLPLADQKLGSHSNPDSTSHKFMLKGRQSGGIHRGHAWVFRAESYDTMFAWFSDIKNLTEKTGAERNAFIQRSHARSLSAGSQKAASVSSDDRALDEDEADQVPYSATESQANMVPSPEPVKQTQRPSPGGRFPSALNVNRDSQVPLSVSSPSSNGEPEIVAAAGALPGNDSVFGTAGQPVGSSYGDTNAARGGLGDPSSAAPDPYSSPIEPVPAHGEFLDRTNRHDSNYGEWMAPSTAGVGEIAAGATGVDAYRRHQTQLAEQKAIQIEEQPGLQAVETVPPGSINTAASVSPTTTFDAPSNAASQLQQSGFPTTIPPAQGSTSVAPGSVMPASNPGTLGPVSPLSDHVQQHPIFDRIGVPGSHANAADPAAPLKTLAKSTDPGEPIRDLASGRPLAGQTNSDLHVPGDFPETPGPMP